MKTIALRLKSLRDRIRAAENRCGRPPETVTLLAVSKTRSAEEIRTARTAGQLHFGENYLQEALVKMEALADLDLEWHFIGPIQSNKTRDIAARFAWVHSVNRLKIAERLSAARPPELPPLNICIQVNIGAEASKSGINLDQLPELAQEIGSLPRLNLRGLMTMPRLTGDEAEQRRQFHELRTGFDRLKALGYPLDTLSMGTSTDLEAAIAEGATIVRIGTAVFGERGAA